MMPHQHEEVQGISAIRNLIHRHGTRGMDLYFRGVFDLSIEAYSTSLFYMKQAVILSSSPMGLDNGRENKTAPVGGTHSSDSSEAPPHQRTHAVPSSPSEVTPGRASHAVTTNGNSLPSRHLDEVVVASSSGSNNTREKGDRILNTQGHHASISDADHGGLMSGKTSSSIYIFQVPFQESMDIQSLESLGVAPAALIFNMALSLHNWGMRELVASASSTAVNQQHYPGPQERHARQRLRQASKLYFSAHELLVEATPTETVVHLMAATQNNLGHVEYQLGNKHTSKACFQHLLRLLVLVSHGLEASLAESFRASVGVEALEGFWSSAMLFEQASIGSRASAA